MIKDYHCRRSIQSPQEPRIIQEQACDPQTDLKSSKAVSTLCWHNNIECVAVSTKLHSKNEPAMCMFSLNIQLDMNYTNIMYSMQHC
jgi:hypothetical protein